MQYSVRNLSNVGLIKHKQEGKALIELNLKITKQHEQSLDIIKKPPGFNVKNYNKCNIFTVSECLLNLDSHIKLKYIRIRLNT